MRLFRPRGRISGGQSMRSPVAQAIALYEAGRYSEAEAEARAVAAARPRRRAPPFGTGPHEGRDRCRTTW
ncbi:hypothetical protein ACWDZW_40655 [Streptomyces coeruleorubidus]